LLRADAFSYGDVPSFMRHQQACIRNDAAIIIFTNAFLDEADDYQSFYKCVFTLRREAMSSDAQNASSCDVYFREPDSE